PGHGCPWLPEKGHQLRTTAGETAFLLERSLCFGEGARPGTWYILADSRLPASSFGDESSRTLLFSTCFVCLKKQK
ncbi:unnamed protein product, partial [Gulo gulo]